MELGNHQSGGLLLPRSCEPILRHLTDNMHVAAFGAMLALVSSYLASSRGQELVAPIGAHFTHMDILAFSTVGLFSSALGGHTFRPRFAAVAGILESITVFFAALTFASLSGVIINIQYRWIVYILCTGPLIPLVRDPCRSLVSALQAMVHKRSSPEASREQHWYLRMRRWVDRKIASVAPRWPALGDTSGDIEGGSGIH